MKKKFKQNISLLKSKIFNNILFFLSLNLCIKIYFLLHFFRKKFFLSFDPLIKVKIGEKKIFMNVSHSLPVYYYKFLNYDRALPRICKKLKETDLNLSVIDVGANIGDTISLITDIVSGNFLCIEGDEQYIPVLKKNIKLMNESNIINIEEVYCGENNLDNLEVDRTNGTAKIIKNKEINDKSDLITNKIRTLDDILENNLNFKNSNLLKIDTDGFEIDVLKSGAKFIKNKKPLLYFEFTPQFYEDNGQDYKTIFDILIFNGYDKALFYNNFGVAIGIFDINDIDCMDDLVKNINKKDIYYYDILTCHHDNINHFNILKSELNLFLKK